jgi:hypothetical protein
MTEDQSKITDINVKIIGMLVNPKVNIYRWHNTSLNLVRLVGTLKCVDNSKIALTDCLTGRELQYLALIDGIQSTINPMFIFHFSDSSGNITCFLNSTCEYLYSKMSNLLTSNSKENFEQLLFNIVGYLSLNPFGGLAINLCSVTDESNNWNIVTYHCLSIIMNDIHYKTCNADPFASSFNRCNLKTPSKVTFQFPLESNCSVTIENEINTQRNCPETKQLEEQKIININQEPHPLYHNITPQLTPSNSDG